MVREARPTCPGAELPFAPRFDGPVDHGKEQDSAPFHSLDGLLWECLIQDLLDPDLSGCPEHCHTGPMLIALEGQLLSGIPGFRAMGRRFLRSLNAFVAFQCVFLKIVNSPNIFKNTLSDFCPIPLAFDNVIIRVSLFPLFSDICHVVPHLPFIQYSIYINYNQ